MRLEGEYIILAYSVTALKPVIAEEGALGQGVDAM